MSLRDELATEPSAAEVQKAYDEAGRYEFMGHRLEPWTVRRHSVALQLKSRLMSAMNDENDSVSRFLEDGFYPHLFHDLVVVLYLMHLNKVEVVELELMPAKEALDRAYTWAETIPLTFGTAPFFEGVKIMGKVLHSMHVSWFQATKREQSDNGQKKIPSADINRPGNSSSFLEQSAPADSMPIT